MPQSLDTWSVIIIVNIAHSIYAIHLLAIKKDFKQREGFWLLLFLLSLLWLQLEFLAIRWPFDIGIEIFYGTRHGSWLLIGPLYYYYIKSITTEGINKWDYLYLIPFLLFTIIVPILLKDFLAFGQVHYGMLTPFDQRPEELTVLQYFYSYLFIFQFCYLTYFIFIAREEIINYSERLKSKFSTINTESISWLKFSWYGLLMILIICIGFIIFLFFFTKSYRRHFDYLYVLPMSFLVYAISYKLAGVRWQIPVQEETSTEKYLKSSLSVEDAECYEKAINDLLMKDKLYLNQELRLKDMSNRLNISNHSLSQVLNQQMNTSFFDLINRFRVMEAKKLIKSNPKYTLLQIAYDAGFNNKTSFVNAFKKFEGRTPSSFLKKPA